MALLGFEGFDHCAAALRSGDFSNAVFGTTAAVNGVWGAGSASPIKIAGLLGGFGWGDGSASQATFLLTLQANYATLIYGLRYKTCNPMDIIASDFLRFQDGASVQCGISTNTSRRLIFWRGTNATVLATGATVLVPAAWYQIEIQVTIDNAAGAVQVLLDGQTEMNVTGLDTQNTANAFMNGVLLLGGPGGAVTTSVIDDFYILDTTGPAPFNTFLTGAGPIRVETTFCTSAVSTGWTPLASTNVSQIDEVDFDFDTTYNSCSAPATDTFNHGALSSTPITIYAVDVIAGVRKTDVTNQSYRTKLISGTSTSNGTSMNPPTAYDYTRDSYQTDPLTGLAWTSTGVNGSVIGYERL